MGLQVVMQQFRQKYRYFVHLSKWKLNHWNKTWRPIQMLKVIWPTFLQRWSSGANTGPYRWRSKTSMRKISRQSSYVLCLFAAVWRVSHAFTVVLYPCITSLVWPYLVWWQLVSSQSVMFRSEYPYVDYSARHGNTLGDLHISLRQLGHIS